MTPERKSEFMHQLERNRTYNTLYEQMKQDRQVICKVIDGRYVTSPLAGGGGMVYFDQKGWTVQVAVQTRSGFEYLDAYFDTRQEAEDAKQVVIDLCMVKAHGK